MRRPSIIVSSNERVENERSEVKRHLEQVGFEVLEDGIGFDFLMYSNSGPIPRERKIFPSDFISSAQDSRFAKECAAMREVSQHPGIILEGRELYTVDGFLKLGSRRSGWNHQGVKNLIRSLKNVEGCDIEWTADFEETAQLLWETQQYFDKTDHTSLRTRASLQSDWLVPTQQERLYHFYQGLPAISVKRAKLIAEQYPSPSQLFQALMDGSLQVPGIGSKLIKKLKEFWIGS